LHVDPTSRLRYGIVTAHRKSKSALVESPARDATANDPAVHPMYILNYGREFKVTGPDALVLVKLGLDDPALDTVQRRSILTRLTAKQKRTRSFISCFSQGSFQ
jgi:hypothetical protein